MNYDEPISRRWGYGRILASAPILRFDALKQLANRLRIGEKIVLGFGAVGLIFLGVIGYYHVNLRDSVSAYQDLARVYGARQVQACAIESQLLATRSMADRFLLTRDPALAETTLRHAETLSAEADALALTDPASATVAAEIGVLADDLANRFAAIVDAWRLRGLDEGSGLQGAFRDAVHELEERVQRQEVPGLEAAVLQMRRREKDYLLRGDADYVAMVDAIGADIEARIQAASLPQEEQAALSALLATYLGDFDALVEQNARIDALTAAMSESAARITPLVEANLASARAAMQARSAELAENSAERARWSMIVAAIAPVLGLLLALLITALIVRPVRHMAELLDRLTRENPQERIATDPEGRDEVNAMGIAVNTLLDHKARFFDWWRRSMQATIACRDLGAADSDQERARAALELRQATEATLAQLATERERMIAEAERLDQLAAGTAGAQVGRSASAELRTIAGDLRTLAGMLEGR